MYPHTVTAEYGFQWPPRPWKEEAALDNEWMDGWVYIAVFKWKSKWHSMYNFLYRYLQKLLNSEQWVYEVFWVVTLKTVVVDADNVTSHSWLNEPITFFPPYFGTYTLQTTLPFYLLHGFEWGNFNMFEPIRAPWLAHPKTKTMSSKC